jgi:hypothetical protein
MKILAFLILLLFCKTAAVAQDSVSKEVERLAKNTSSVPYGTNKAVGKY